MAQNALETITLLTSDKVKEDHTTEKLRIYYKYGDTPLNWLQATSTNYILPKQLSDCTFPIYTAFLYRNEIKHPRKTKIAIYINEYKPVASVGDCIIVNVLVSSTTGLILHMSEFIMRPCYQYACVFVDHNYDFTYVHLLESQTGDKEVEPKEALESKSEFHGVDIKNYHAVKWNFKKCTMDEPLQGHELGPQIFWS